MNNQSGYTFTLVSNVNDHFVSRLSTEISTAMNGNVVKCHSGSAPTDSFTVEIEGQYILLVYRPIATLSSTCEIPVTCLKLRGISPSAYSGTLLANPLERAELLRCPCSLENYRGVQLNYPMQAPNGLVLHIL